ncbi:hypothetical protein [Nodosilinea sp. E11]|uniref:hypothetical protein n=1 Tax=Nodosilinea sp. E11 TaxID=3037479 RepID=UPI002934D49E|nr:hypothetical protein [Nodosilinea sp. E11]WOD38678.1 hypothetical protein RRF56_20925 [Nodosilinea sp. E11]
MATTDKYRRHGSMALATGLLLGIVGTLPVLAQANFETFNLSEASPTSRVSGFTTGIVALSNIAGRDGRGTICAGFADTTPDHIMVLEQDFDSLILQVDSGGNDTSLLIQGPNDSTVRCGQDTNRRNPDARVEDQGWQTGTYRIWVGSHHQGQRYNYSLSVSP